MARQKGMLNLSGNLEPLAGAPLDSRDITPTVADLYIASNWPYKYIGMKTTVTATGDTYRLVNLDVTQESSWVKEGSGESGASSLSDLKDVDLINPEEGETLIYDGEGGWTNGPAGQTYSDFTGATAQEAGAHGLVPAPTTGDISKFLKGDGTWATVPMPSFDYSNTSPEAMNFSTDEKVIGTWVDGKPLYQKKITGTSPSTPGYINNNIGLTNVDKVISIKGICNTRANITVYAPVPNTDSSSSEYEDYIEYNASTDSLYWNGGERTLGRPFWMTFQYTKTTDSAVASGEKIVGQWIDGKPVFEKVYDLGSNITISDNNWYVVSSISTSDKFIVMGWGLRDDGVYFPICVSPFGSGEKLELKRTSENPKIRYIILRYTKTT